MTPRPPSNRPGQARRLLQIRARLPTGLATVHVRQEEIEQACRTAGEAWRIATRTRTALSLQQVHDVRRQPERWQDSRAVRELDEHDSGLPASVITAP